jgi:hypothetical protein
MRLVVFLVESCATTELCLVINSIEREVEREKPEALTVNKQFQVRPQDAGENLTKH